MGAEIQPTMHPKAEVRIPTHNIRENIQEILSRSEMQEQQLQQYSELLDLQRAELKQMSEELKKLEPFRNLSQDTAKYWTCYIRNPVVVQKLRARMIQFYGRAGDTASESETVRKAAARRLDEVVEECVRHCVFNIWHIVKRNLEEKPHAK